MLFTQFPHLRKVLWGVHCWNPLYYVGTAGHVSSEIIQPVLFFMVGTVSTYNSYYKTLH